jgi:hypothetical protein
MSTSSNVALSYVTAVFDAAASIGSAGAVLARAVVNAAVNGHVDAESITQAIDDGCQYSNASAAVYKSQARRLLGADAALLSTIWAEREATNSWANMGRLITVYEVPALASSGAKKKGKPAATTAANDEGKGRQTPSEYVHGLRAYLAAFTVVGFNDMAAQDALTTCVAILAKRVSEMDAATKAKAAAN